MSRTTLMTATPGADSIHMIGGSHLSPLASEYVLGRYRRREIQGPARRAIDQTLRTLCESFGGRPLNQLSPKAIDRWMESHAHLAPSTRRNHVSRVRTFCRWLVNNGHIRRDPTTHLERIVQPRRIPVTLNRQEIDHLRATLPDLRARLIVALMWDSCCRCIEVSRLRVEDYDPLGSTVFLRGKGGHERVVPIDSSTRELMEQYLSESGAVGGPLIRSKMDPSQGVAAATLSHYVRQWMVDAGVKRRPLDGRSAHGLRRTGGSEIMEACDNIRVVQAHLGHARIETTARYYLRPVSMEKMREAAEARHAPPEAA